MLEKELPKVVKKKWGEEIWIKNFEKYCGKVLRFNQDAHFSYHFHLLKEETWYIVDGIFTMVSKSHDSGYDNSITLLPGDVVHIKPGESHFLGTRTGGSIFEISTQHFDEDSYRINNGNEYAF